MKRTLLTLTFALASVASADLRGAAIIATDGTFLGMCDGLYGAASLANPASPYGSPFSRTSIYNKSGPYGSLYDTYSAYKVALANPPYLIQMDDAVRTEFTQSGYRVTPEFLHILSVAPVNRITANRLMQNAIHPDELRRECAQP